MVSHLTSLIVQDVVKISLREFCAGYVPAWRYIDPAKQGEISRNTRELLTDLSRDSTGRSLILRETQDPPEWVLHQNAEFRRRQKFYYGFLDRFIAKKRGEEDQPQLPFE